MALKIPDLQPYTPPPVNRPAYNTAVMPFAIWHRAPRSKFRDAISCPRLTNRNISRVYIYSLQLHGVYIDITSYVNADDFIILSV